jgi:hypothetical protein
VGVLDAWHGILVGHAGWDKSDADAGSYEQQHRLEGARFAAHPRREASFSTFAFDVAAKAFRRDQRRHYKILIAEVSKQLVVARSEVPPSELPP